MSRKSRRRRHKKNKFMSSVLYYVLVLALVAGLVFVVKVNHQERAERTEYKEKLAGKETVDSAFAGACFFRNHLQRSVLISTL